MALETILISTDSEIKNQVAELSDKLGLNTSTAINMFFKAFIQAGRLPFDIEYDPLSNPEDRKRLFLELDQYVDEAEKPGAIWYSRKDVEKRLGLTE